jgi:hypothetical protein
VLLQRLTEADELFRPGTKGVRLSKAVLLGSLGQDMTGVTLHVHPPKGKLKRHQSILSCGDGSFPAI